MHLLLYEFHLLLYELHLFLYEFHLLLYELHLFLYGLHLLLYELHLHVSIWKFRNRVCLSVRTQRKKNRNSFVNISPTLVIDTSMKRSSSTTAWKLKNYILFSFKSSKLNFDFSQVRFFDSAYVRLEILAIAALKK